MVSDDESDELDNVELVNAFEQLQQNNNSSFTETTDEDELIALELEISEIDEEINRLRQKRSRLYERQQKIKDSIKQNQNSTLNVNAVETWQRTGKLNETQREKGKFKIRLYYSYYRLDFPWSAEVERVRKEIFKINSFRQWQLETINVTLSNQDCILIMPTGGGKSLCYQLPAVISDGKYDLIRIHV